MNDEQQQTSRVLARKMHDTLMAPDVAPATDTEDRALWRIETVLAGFYDEPDDEDDPGMAVRDLLTDLIHYCRANELSLEAELAGAEDMAGMEHGEWEERASWDAAPATTTPPAITVEDRNAEVELRERAEQIGLEVIGNIDIGEGIQRTPVAFTDAIRSSYIGAETVSNVVTAAAYKGLKERR